MVQKICHAISRVFNAKGMHLIGREFHRFRMRARGRYVEIGINVMPSGEQGGSPARHVAQFHRRRCWRRTGNFRMGLKSSEGGCLQ